MALRTIEQKINAASQFTGAAPAGTAVNQFDMERFPSGTVGGLFDFALTQPARVEQISIKLGGQSSWSLVVLDVDAVVTTLLTGTTEVSVVNSTLRPWLLEGQKLRLITTGATTAMVARMSIDSSPS